MIAIPLGGWLMVSVSPFQVATVLYGVASWPHLPFTEGLIGEDLYEFTEFFHSKGAWVIIALLALHVAGAVKHEIGAEEGVLKKMIPGLFGRSDPPALPPKGFLFAFGGSAALFAAIAAFALLGSGPANPGPPPPGGSGTGVQANWIVDYEKSAITFSGLHEGRKFEGVFDAWTADVAFYPEALATSQVHVSVDTRTARTGKKLYDDSLKSREWFNAPEFPQATVELGEFRQVAGGYEAAATLTLKGRPVRLPNPMRKDQSTIGCPPALRPIW
jgi:cytochrome b561